MKRIVGRNLSTPCCQTLTPDRKVVFEYKAPKVFVCKSDTFFLVHPVVATQKCSYSATQNCCYTKI